MIPQEVENTVKDILDQFKYSTVAQSSLNEIAITYRSYQKTVLFQKHPQNFMPSGTKKNLEFAGWLAIPSHGLEPGYVVTFSPIETSAQPSKNVIYQQTSATKEGTSRIVSFG